MTVEYPANSYNLLLKYLSLQPRRGASGLQVARARPGHSKALRGYTKYPNTSHNQTKTNSEPAQNSLRSILDEITWILIRQRPYVSFQYVL